METRVDGIIQVLEFAMAARDPYTVFHQKRVATLACTLAREMGLSPERLQGLHLAGSLHDLGKVAIPLEILSKPGKLNAIEFAMIKTHPQVGHEILQPLNLSGPINQIILQHHERLDGSGYPHGLRGDDILLESRILAVADVVEAMCSHRPYRPSLGVAVALEELTNHRGTKYDARVVDTCLKLHREEALQQLLAAPPLSPAPPGAYQVRSQPPVEDRRRKILGNFRLFPENWNRFFIHATFACSLVALVLIGGRLL